MTAKQAIAYEEQVISKAKEWVKGKAEISQEEIAIIAEHYGQTLPSGFIHFISSESPRCFVATSCAKTISDTLQSLAKKIKKQEGKK